MSVSPLPIEPLEPGPDRLAALTDAFETEGRLLDELARVLLRQRDGLAANDIEILDESVYAAQRVFLTLHEARKRRKALLRLATGQEELRLKDLESVLGPDVPSALIESRDRLLETAQRLERELRVNRQVINGAMGVGDEIIRAMTGGEDSAVYTPDPEKRAGGEAGTLINKRV